MSQCVLSHIPIDRRDQPVAPQAEWKNTGLAASIVKPPRTGLQAPELVFAASIVTPMAERMGILFAKVV